MKQYHQLLKHILKEGVQKPASRENMPGTQSRFGYQFRHNLQDGFPLLTTKEMYWKGVVVELLWFLRGDTNIKFLLDNGVNIWNQDAYRYYLKKIDQEGTGREPLSFDEFIQHLKEGKPVPPTNGDCGHQYGKVWRDLKDVRVDERGNLTRVINIDQIKRVISNIRKKPYSRRHLVTSVIPTRDKDLALYWCHALFQFNVRPGEDGEPKYLDLQLYQRSADVFLGVPFNIASYALLLHIIAALTGLEVGEFIHTFGDVHIYDNHKEQVQTQLSRDVNKYDLPQVDLPLNINEEVDIEVDGILQDLIESLHWSDFTLEGYESYPSIKAELKTGLNLNQKK